MRGEDSRRNGWGAGFREHDYLPPACHLNFLRSVKTRFRCAPERSGMNLRCMQQTAAFLDRRGRLHGLIVDCFAFPRRRWVLLPRTEIGS